MSDEERRAMYGAASAYDEDSDDMEWEEVDMRDKPARDEVIEFTLQVDKGKAPAKKIPVMSAEERAARLNAHKVHTIALITSAGIRNRWACNQLLHARLMSLVPLSLQNAFSMIHKRRIPEASKRGRLFEAAITRLCTWWVESFDIRDGLGIQSWTFDQVRAGAMDQEVGETLRSVKSLMKHALQLAGSQDVSAQLFTALCRALGIPSRLVFSIQSVPWQASKGKKPVPRKHEEDEDEEAGEASVAVPSIQSKSRKKRGKGRKLNEDTPTAPLAGWPPVFWTEVFSRPDGRWLPVDPIRNLVNKKKLFEPPRNAPHNRMTYVVAFEEDGFVRDVTARYASTNTLRKSRGRAHGEWWARILQPLTRPYRLHRDDVEDDELAAVTLHEGMPSSVGAFKDHPLYALERHLRRDEVINPRVEVGKFRGEPVFARSNVISLKTAENWMRQGRSIRAGAQPLKHVPMHAVTIYRRREIEAARADGRGEQVLQAMYGFAQTEVYVPLPVVDGKVPKNDFGNIDLYVPSMLPEGAVHIAHKGVAKIARQLKVDYAEAVTGFEFKKQRANPIITGIVVASENEERVLEEYWASVADSEEKERAKRQDRVLKRWTRLVHGLRIRERLLKEYGTSEREPEVQTQEEVEPAPLQGGFVSALNSTIQHFSLPKNAHAVVEHAAVPSSADVDVGVHIPGQTNGHVSRFKFAMEGDVTVPEDEEAGDDAGGLVDVEMEEVEAVAKPAKAKGKAKAPPPPREESEESEDDEMQVIATPALKTDGRTTRRSTGRATAPQSLPTPSANGRPRRAAAVKARTASQPKTKSRTHVRGRGRKRARDESDSEETEDEEEFSEDEESGDDGDFVTTPARPVNVGGRVLRNRVPK